MASDRQRRDQLVGEILRGVPQTPAQWSADDLQRFVENIVRAIEHAFAEEAQESQQPEFGEEDRAS